MLPGEAEVALDHQSVPLPPAYLLLCEDIEAGAVLPGKAEVALDHQSVPLPPAAEADHQLLFRHHLLRLLRGDQGRSSSSGKLITQRERTS